MNNKSKPNQIYWKNAVNEFKKSNLPQKEWCEKKNISYTKFKYWKQRFDKESKAISEAIEKNETKDPHWIAIETVEEVTNFEESHIKLTIGKINIETTPNFNEQHLEKIIKVISRV